VLALPVLCPRVVNACKTVPEIVVAQFTSVLVKAFETKAHPNYGLDSPRIVATLFASGTALCCLGLVFRSAWHWIPFGLGMCFLFGASGMVFYSKVGKLRMRERLLDRIPWRDERVLDVGCGR
jgi:hypothetical protein